MPVSPSGPDPVPVQPEWEHVWFGTYTRTGDWREALAAVAPLIAAAAREQERAALIAVCAANDASLLPDDEGYCVDPLFERGILTAVRDYTDEYTTILTEEGREFVGNILARSSSVATTDRSAGRWCEVCQEHGSHHTDRHPSSVPTTEEQKGAATGE